MFKFSTDISIAITSNSFLFQPLSDEIDPLIIPAFCARTKNRILAIGEEAQEMMENTPPNFVANKVIEEGIITDQEGAQAILKFGLKKYKNFLKPRVLCNSRFEGSKVPLKFAIEASGVKEIFLIWHGMACAIGIGLPVTESKIQAVLTIEDDWFDFSVISLAGVLCNVSKAFGVNDIVEDAMWFYKEKNNAHVLRQQLLERLQNPGLSGQFAFDGWESWSENTETGKLVNIEVTPESLDIATFPAIVRISEQIRNCLQTLSNEQRLELHHNGAHLCGEGAKISGLSKRFSKQVGIPFMNKSEKIHPVIVGLNEVLSQIDTLASIAIK